ncbi:hypothetical protein TNCV_671221 [Trichonephila clavipes]|nr:hypothetical protein TNCV_671221 [Trichonephila clavipes]
MLWSRQQSAFVVEAYFSNGQSAIVVQRVYCRPFYIPPLGRVPDRKYVLMWMDASEQQGMSQKNGKTSEDH